MNDNTLQNPMGFNPEILIKPEENLQSPWRFLFKIILGYICYIALCIGMEGYSRKHFNIIPEKNINKINSRKEKIQTQLDQSKARNARTQWLPYQIYLKFVGAVVLISFLLMVFVLLKALKDAHRLKKIRSLGRMTFFVSIGGIGVMVVAFLPLQFAVSCFEKGWLK
jgi:hypothetical protein